MRQREQSAQNALRPYEKLLEHQIKDLEAFAERCKLMFEAYAKCDATFKDWIKEFEEGEVYAVYRFLDQEERLLVQLEDLRLPDRWFNDPNGEIDVKFCNARPSLEAFAKVKRKPSAADEDVRSYVTRESLDMLSDGDRTRLAEILRQYVQKGEEFPLTVEPMHKNNRKFSNNKELLSNIKDFAHFFHEGKFDLFKAHLWLEFPASEKIEKEPKSMYAAVNTFEPEQMKSAVTELISSPTEAQQPLLDLFSQPQHMRPEFAAYKYDGYQEGEIEWQALKDPKKAGTEQQREFVDKALKTPDFAVMEGPPGSGKTTAILELILQLIAQNKRVLLVSATHVAIDNVLKHLVDYMGKYEKTHEVLAARISANSTRISSPEVREQFWQPNVLKRQFEASSRMLESLPMLTAGQKLLASALKNENDLEDLVDFQDFVLQQCNVVAGTMVGILQHPSIKKPRGEWQPFDYLIVDEASKVTVQGFLVPARLARRWVLVGDIKQLAPHADNEALIPYVAESLEEKPEEAAKVVSQLSKLFEYRFSSDFVGKQEQRFKKITKRFSDEQRKKLELMRRLAYPSILDALQNGTAYKGTRELPYDNLIYTGLPIKLGQAWKDRFVSLTYQHRMCDEIARHPRRHFYGDKNLQSSSAPPRANPLADYRHGESPAVWVELERNSDQGKNSNEREAEQVKAELEAMCIYADSKKIPKLEIAVLTFYRSQEQTLKRKLDEWLKVKDGPLRVVLNTVDSFQGQEADVVLLCFTKWGGEPFYNVPNRLNVAITRAKHKLVLFGKPCEMQGDKFTQAIRGMAREIPCRRNDIQQPDHSHTDTPIHITHKHPREYSHYIFIKNNVCLDTTSKKADRLIHMEVKWGDQACSPPRLRGG